ncbi:MAG: class I SAM-dependent methyltransferase [Labedaea sp.]
MDAEELFAKRASSFGKQAAEYAEHRPDYPMPGIRWSLAGPGPDVHRVLDLAAGTGKLTDGLLTLGLEVIAVEPDPEMRGVLSTRFPEVMALAGTAEEIPLPDSSVDAVLAGQAFHWFDTERALTETARVLRPGGLLAALWNREDERVGWVAQLAALTSTGVTRSWNYEPDFPDHPAYSRFERKVFPHSHRRTAESLTATIGTHSHTLVVAPAERATLLSAIRRFLDTAPETAGREFDLPLRTTVIRARRS